MSARLPASCAACKRMNCSFALRTNPSASKPASARSAAPAAGVASKCECAAPRFAPAHAGCAAPACAPAPSRRSKAKPAHTSSAINSSEPNSSDKPRCDINAASPRPAAMPAIGPSHERLPALPAALPAAGAVLGGVVGAALGGVTCRRIPKLPPPPKRRASASSGAKLPKTKINAHSARKKGRTDFMRKHSPVKKTNHLNARSSAPQPILKPTCSATMPALML